MINLRKGPTYKLRQMSNQYTQSRKQPAALQFFERHAIKNRQADTCFI